MIPYSDWHGAMAGATTWTGRRVPCAGTPDLCSSGIWPGSSLSAFYDPRDPINQQAWFGSLTSGQSDGSNFMYMRNRYYNPQTGSFTQPDPIGVAGGLNLYGFAGGDPVSYSDPFGLCPAPCGVEFAGLQVSASFLGWTGGVTAGHYSAPDGAYTREGLFVTTASGAGKGKIPGNPLRRGFSSWASISITAVIGTSTSLDSFKGRSRGYEAHFGHVFGAGGSVTQNADGTTKSFDIGSIDGLDASGVETYTRTGFERRTQAPDPTKRDTRALADGADWPMRRKQ